MVLSPIDYVIIALYFIVIVAIGFIAARFAKTKEDYLVAGRRLSFPLFFGCMAALTLGGGSTIGSAQLGYEFGLGGIWLNLSIGLGLVAAGFLVTSKLSKLRALSGTRWWRAATAPSPACSARRSRSSTRSR